MSRSKHQHKKNYLGFSTRKLKKLTNRKIRTRAWSIFGTLAYKYRNWVRS